MPLYDREAIRDLIAAGLLARREHAGEANAYAVAEVLLQKIERDAARAECRPPLTLCRVCGRGDGQ